MAFQASPEVTEAGRRGGGSIGDATSSCQIPRQCQHYKVLPVFDSLHAPSKPWVDSHLHSRDGNHSMQRGGKCARTFNWQDESRLIKITFPHCVGESPKGSRWSEVSAWWWATFYSSDNLGWKSSSETHRIEWLHWLMLFLQDFYTHNTCRWTKISRHTLNTQSTELGTRSAQINDIALFSRGSQLRQGYRLTK